MLSGDNGNDVILGRDGDDTLNGGPGDDSLFGENGNDTLIGGGGNDFLDEGPGQGGVLIYGTPGNDVILVGRTVFNGLPHVITTINEYTTFQPYINGETINFCRADPTEETVQHYFFNASYLNHLGDVL